MLSTRDAEKAFTLLAPKSCALSVSGAVEGEFRVVGRGSPSGLVARDSKPVLATRQSS